MELLKRDTRPADPIITLGRQEDDDEHVFRGIQCPLCAWQPTPSSRWRCDASAAPEPYFQGCLTEWNTFTTRGRCPGCGHEWAWTSCLRCSGWSRHEDWYRG
jgi:hypothetical protein